MAREPASGSVDGVRRTLQVLGIAAIVATIGPTLIVEIASWIGLMPERRQPLTMLVLQGVFLAATWPAILMLALVRDWPGRGHQVIGVASAVAIVATAIDVVAMQAVRACLVGLGLDLRAWTLRIYTIAWACGAFFALWAIRRILPLSR